MIDVEMIKKAHSGGIGISRGHLSGALLKVVVMTEGGWNAFNQFPAR